MRVLLALAVLASGCAGLEQARKEALAVDALWSCSCAVTGLTTGRSAPEGPEELWVAAGREIVQVAGDGTSSVVWTAPVFTEILRFEVADLDADGIDEWVVVLDAGSVRSVVVGVEDGVRTQRGKAWAGWLRTWTQGPPMLLGQRVGGDRPYWGTVSKLELDDKGRWQPVEGGPLYPPRVGIFDPFTLAAAPERIFGLREDGRVVEYGPTTGLASPEQWVSDGRPIGRPIELRRTFRSVLGEEEEAVVRLPPPVVALSGGGGLAVTGTPAALAVFEDFVVHRGGEVRAVHSTPERGLSWGTRTPVVGRAITAATPWTPNGREVWAAAVWTRAPQDFGPPESRILLFDPTRGDALAPSALEGPHARWPAPRAPRPSHGSHGPSEVP